MTIHYVDTEADLQKLADSLSQKSEMAIDLEFDRNRYRYGFNMCLMQIYDGSACYLVDPLSKQLDIETIFPVLEDPEIQKVVFAFGEDLRLLHSLGCFPKNIYDLDVATSLLNFEPASLTNLIIEVLDIQPNSSSQQSNWYKRPLSDEQKEYAADDVLYLLDFKKALQAQLEQRDLTEWVRQENAIFDALDYSKEDHNILIKDKDKNNMTMYEWHIYKKLMEFFDEVAQSYNKPVYQLVNKRLVESLAKDPNKVEQWTRTKGIFGKLKNDSFKNRLKEVIEEATTMAKDQQLSTSRKASHTLSGEDYQDMRQRQSQISHLATKLMKPIQQEIAEDLGRHTKSFILPNRLTKEIVAGEHEPLPKYKTELLQKYARKLDIDLSEYL